MIHPTAVIYPGVELGENAVVEPFVILGSPDGAPLSIGRDAVIRAYTRIEGGDVIIGDGFQTGNHALVRGRVRVGDRTRIGSYTSLEGQTGCWLGDDVTVRGRCELPDCHVDNRVQIYAGSILSDTRKPPEGGKEPPVIHEGAVLFLYVLVMAGVEVGAGARVAAGAIVHQDVPDGYLYKRSGETVPWRS